MEKSKRILFDLIHKAIDESYVLNLEDYEGVDWKAVMLVSVVNGVHAIAFEAINSLPSQYRPERRLLLNWFGQVSYLEEQYEKKWKVACELADMWGKENVSALVLKGRSVAQYYPVPSHRFSCDLDVFIENGWDKACSILEKHGVKLVYEVYKEVEFRFKGVYVECHRYITPVRGNKNLQKFESYLRSLLAKENLACFEQSRLMNPPIMFTVMLYVEHAINDFIKGEISVKHLVDWMVLRKLDNIDWEEFAERCKEFKYDRFVTLLNTLADVAEGKKDYDSMPVSYRKALDGFFHSKEEVKGGKKSWFQRRVGYFMDLIKNWKRFDEFGYCSMPSFLFNALWTHFFDKEVKI